MKNSLKIYPTVEELLKIFIELNEECRKTGERVVKLTETEYYAEQICNMYGFSWSKCLDLAREMSIKVCSFDKGMKVEVQEGIKKMISYEKVSSGEKDKFLLAQGDIYNITSLDDKFVILDSCYMIKRSIIVHLIKVI